MRKFLFPTLITILTLIACTPSAAPTPTITPTDLPATATATAAPTATPEPTEIPHPNGWEDTWVVVEGYWMSPEMAAYVEKHDGHVEEIDGKNYFTTMVTVSIDGQTQDVKVKLLEESETGELIPSYETVRDLFAENKARVVKELSRIVNAENTLFVIRPGIHLEEDLARADVVIEELINRVNVDIEDNLWPDFGIYMRKDLWTEPENILFTPDEKYVYIMGFDNKLKEIFSSDGISKIEELSIENETLKQQYITQYGIDPRRPAVLLFVGVLGTDQLIGLIPCSVMYDEDRFMVSNIGFDQSFYQTTFTRESGSSDVFQFRSFGETLYNLLNIEDNIDNLEIKTFVYDEDIYSTLDEDISKELLNGPALYYQILSQNEWNFADLYQNTFGLPFNSSAVITLDRKIIWVTDFFPQRLCNWHVLDSELCRNIMGR
jgi:hypothetical protein